MTETTMVDEGNSSQHATFNNDFTLEVQRKFLSLLLFDKNWAMLSGLDIIKPAYFENRVLKNVCQWIHEYYLEYRTFPTQIVMTEKAKDYINSKSTLSMKDFFLYDDVLKSIFDIGTNEDLEFFKEQAVVFVRQMAWRHALQKGTDILKLGTYEEAIDAFSEVLSLGSEADLGLDISELSTETFLETLAESYDEARMLKTGVPGWDKALGGGFVNRNVHIIGAPPGGGKSRIMAYLAKTALSNFKKVIFITLELSQDETLANIYTAATGIGITQMLKPERREEFIQKVAAFRNEYSSDLVVKFYKPGAHSANTLHNYIKKVIMHKTETLGREWQPDVIFIDYMDKLIPTHKSKGSMYEDGGGIATDCKNLGISFNCPIITGSQLGRVSWNLSGSNVVSMESIADSAQKVHIAHSMTTINFNPGEKENNKARLYLAKSRSGKPGSMIWCENNLGRCLVTEIEPWDPSTLQGTTVYTFKENGNV